jgi:hypothetical protein
MVVSMIASDPISATSSAELPSMIEGTMNMRTIATLTTRPSRARAPRSRPPTMTRSAKITASKSSGRPRSKSEKE